LTPGSAPSSSLTHSKAQITNKTQNTKHNHTLSTYNKQGEAAAAINWVLKDGAGRLGRFLFARWGRELDCELKQFRLAGDILMEAGEQLPPRACVLWGGVGGWGVVDET